jgi:hypothetical protein
MCAYSTKNSLGPMRTGNVGISYTINCSEKCHLPMETLVEALKQTPRTSFLVENFFLFRCHY